jgi:Zn-dependent metalloprotease
VASRPEPADRYVALARPADLHAATAQRWVDDGTARALQRIWDRDPTAFVLVDGHTGRVVHAVGQLSAPLDLPDPEILAAFIADNAEMLHASRPGLSFVPQRAPTRFERWRTYRLRQSQDGVPVLKRSLVLELDDQGRVTTMSGVPDDDLGLLPPLTPTLSDPEAVQAMEAWLALRPGLSVLDRAPPVLVLHPGVHGGAAHLAWRQGVMTHLEGAPAPRAHLLSLDAHAGEVLGFTDVTRECTDGARGTVVTSSEAIRISLAGGSPVTRTVETCYSSWFDEYFLEDHRLDSTLYTYDGTTYTDPGGAGTWYSTCLEPACYTVSQGSNAWTSFHASDFRNARRVLDFFRVYYGRNGADDSGENLIIVSGVNYDNATAMGIFRAIAFGKPDPARGMPSYGILDVAGHEFTHIVQWHEWVGIFDYGFEGSIHGVEGAVDEHFADIFGILATYYYGDEQWVRDTRWAHAVERRYGANYPHRNDANFWNTMQISRNYYKGTNWYTPRAHISHVYLGPDDAGGVHTNAIILGRAAYLYTEGGYVDESPDGAQVANWPAGGPDWYVSPIGMDRLRRIAYKTLTTGSFNTPLGAYGLGDIEQAEQDYNAMKWEFQKAANINYAACLSLAPVYSWSYNVCASVRNAYAGVGLMEADRDYDTYLDNTDNCVSVANGDQRDTDGDGRGDACDPCTDADGDGLGNGTLANTGCVNPATDTNDRDRSRCGDTDGDGCDDCSSRTFNPASDGPDTDGDGWCNTGDNCPAVANPGQANADRDALGDACDNCTDADRDGLGNGTLGNAGCVVTTLDSHDNDPTRCADTDGDGCDDCANLAFNPAQDGPDPDGDGRCSRGDNCPWVANPAQADGDGDGVGDACDTCQDVDHDGVGDGTGDNAGCVNPVTDRFPTNPARCADTDADGCDDCSGRSFNPAADGPDRDGDGACDAGDGCPDDPGKRAPLSCGCGMPETDSDRDGVADCVDGCPADPAKTAPGFCGCGAPEPDGDGDGVPDCADGCPRDPGKSAPGACGCGISDRDTDGDTTPDCLDGCRADPAKTNPGACGCGQPDVDSDGDSLMDCLDGCPQDPVKTAPGACGCGQADRDTDGDTFLDCQDGCPQDPAKQSPGVCGCGVSDADTDGDRVPDCLDGCPADPAKTAPGTCGCAVPEVDRDGDGRKDCVDGCPQDPRKTEPGVCGCGRADTDTDRDGLPDCAELGGLDPNSPDSDGDTILDGEEVSDPAAPRDTDGDGTVDALDLDSDGDTIPDAQEAGDADLATPAVDTDNDGVPDYRDPDADGDGVQDQVDNCRTVANSGQEDADGDGRGDACDDDDDNDGHRDDGDNCPGAPNPGQEDLDRDGRGDACDGDDDNDGVPDAEDNCPRVANAGQEDADGNGRGAACDGDEPRGDEGVMAPRCRCASGNGSAPLTALALALVLASRRLARRDRT